MSIFDRPANYDQRFYGESPHRRVEPIAPANPIQSDERGHVSDKPMVNNVPIQAAMAEAEMWVRTNAVERELSQKGLKVDIIV